MKLIWTSEFFKKRLVQFQLFEKNSQVQINFRLNERKTLCSLLGTDNVSGQISEHIFEPNGDYCLYIFDNNNNNNNTFIRLVHTLTLIKLKCAKWRVLFTYINVFWRHCVPTENKEENCYEASDLTVDCENNRPSSFQGRERRRAAVFAVYSQV